MTATATSPSSRKADVVLDRDRVAPAGASGAILQIPLDLIDIGENVRKSIPENTLAELAASITEHGVREPVTVADAPGDRYELVTGQRRFLASRLAGKATIPAILDNEGHTAAERAILQLVENLQKEDMAPLERARAMKAVVDAGMTQAALAKQLGIGESTVTNDLSLLKAPVKVQEAVASGQITPAHAKAIKGLSDADQEMLLEEALEERLSAHELEEAVQQHKRDVEWRAEQAAESAEKARAAMEKEAAQFDDRVKKVPLDTLICLRGDTWNENGKARLEAVDAKLRELGYTKVKRESAQARPKGHCDCTAWKVEVSYYGGLTIAPACVVQAHVNAKYAADNARDRAKHALYERVHNHVKSTATAWPINGAIAAAVGLDPNATAIAIPRILAESALWGLLAYRLPEWSVAHGGKRNTAWAVIHALPDDELAKELAKELAADFRDKAGYHVDWAALDEEITAARAAKPVRAQSAPEAPAFGQLAIAGDVRYRISKVAGTTIHLAADGRQWRNNPVIARTKAERLTWDGAAAAWRGDVTPTRG